MMLFVFVHAGYTGGVCGNLFQDNQSTGGHLDVVSGVRSWRARLGTGLSICACDIGLAGKIEGKRPRGKPRRKMLDLLMEQEEKKISYEELKRGAQSRVGWCHRHWNLP